MLDKVNLETVKNPDAALSTLLALIESNNRILVLVHSQLQQRQLLRLLQERLQGFAPEIQTLDTWLNQIIIRSLPSSELKKIKFIIGPRERSLVLSEWLANHRLNSAKIFSSSANRRLLAHWISQIHRSDQPLDCLQRYQPDHRFPQLITSYARYIESQDWLDREVVPKLITKCDQVSGLPETIVLFDLEDLPALTQRALNQLGALSPKIEWKQIEIQAPEELENPHLWEFHSPFEEALYVLAHIQKTVTAKDSAQLTDYQIFIPDASQYRLALEWASRITGIPIYISRPQGFLHHPVAHRLLALLRLLNSNMTPRDLDLVFGDNLLELNVISGIEAAEPVSVRNFYDFCLKMNWSTIEEVRTGLRQDSGDERFNLKASDRSFLTQVLGMIDELQKAIDQEEPKTLSEWLDLIIIPLLHRQGKLSSEVTTSVYKGFIEKLGSLSAMNQTIGAGQAISYHQALEFIEEYLSAMTEALVDFPDALQVAEIGFTTIISDKTIFVMGMNDGWIPGAMTTDFVRFQYQKTIAKHIDPGLPRRDIADLEFLGKLRAENRAPIFTRPRTYKDKDQTPSSYWLDLVADGVKVETKQPSSEMQEGFVGKAFETAQTAQTTDLLNDEDLLHIKLARDIELQRSDVEEMGVYDGVLNLRIEEDAPLFLSASSLRTYLNNPMEFFFKNVLELAPKEEFIFDIEPSTRGEFIHRIAEKYYLPHPTLGSPFWQENTEDRHRALHRITELVNETFDEFAPKLGGSESPEARALKKHVLNMFRSWVQLESDYAASFVHGKKYRPLSFFPDSKLGLESDFELTLSDINVTIKLRIDRIDYDPESEELLIIDYKSSVTPPGHNSILRMEDLQLPMYILAVEPESFEKTAAAYWSLSPNKIMDNSRFKPAMAPLPMVEIAKKPPPWAFQPQVYHNMLKYVRDVLIAKVAENIRNGIFNPSIDEKTKYYDKEFEWLMRVNPDIQKRRSLFLGAEKEPYLLKRNLLAETTKMEEDGE